MKRSHVAIAVQAGQPVILRCANQCQARRIALCPRVAGCCYGSSSGTNFLEIRTEPAPGLHRPECNPHGREAPALALRPRTSSCLVDATIWARGQRRSETRIHEVRWDLTSQGPRQCH